MKNSELLELEVIDTVDDTTEHMTVYDVRDRVASAWQDDDDTTQEHLDEIYTAPFERLQEMALGIGYYIRKRK